MNHKQGWASGAMRRNAFAFLTRQERRKYEIALELGLMGREARAAPSAVPKPLAVPVPFAVPKPLTVPEPPDSQATKEGE